MISKSTLVAGLVALCLSGVSTTAAAHCDTLTGPVVAAARAALIADDVTPVLKWVRASEEAEVRSAFGQAVAVRGLNDAARELADRFFFETVVRLHRAGEGEPYTGLKEGTAIDEAIEGADRAIQTGDVEPLVALVTAHAAAALRERFVLARSLRGEAEASIPAGRRYVSAYVDFLHFVERLTVESEGER